MFKQNCRGTPVVYFDDAIVVNGYNVVVSDLNCSTTDARPEVLGRSQISQWKDIDVVGGIGVGETGVLGVGVPEEGGYQEENHGI